jgi:hypothetical protein
MPLFTEDEGEVESAMSMETQIQDEIKAGGMAGLKGRLGFIPPKAPRSNLAGPAISPSLQPGLDRVPLKFRGGDGPPRLVPVAWRFNGCSKWASEETEGRHLDGSLAAAGQLRPIGQSYVPRCSSVPGAAATAKLWPECNSSKRMLAPATPRNRAVATWSNHNPRRAL